MIKSCSKIYATFVGNPKYLGGINKLSVGKSIYYFEYIGR